VEKEGGSIGGTLAKIHRATDKTTLKKKGRSFFQRRFICRSVDFWYLGVK
jgi:hypothetical protein